MLAKVKSIVLITDLPEANALTRRLFSDSFDVLCSKSREAGKNVELHLSGMLEAVLEEADVLPPDSVEIILAQFLHADPSIRSSANKTKKIDELKTEDSLDKIFKQLPPSYNVAKNLCNTCVSQMARYVSQYFGNVIVDATNLDTDQQDGKHSTMSDEDLEQLDKAHRLLRELWRSCPGVLQNVIPQIEAELTAENVQIRSLATEAIGDLIAGIGAGGNIQPPAINPAVYPLDSSTASDDERRNSSISQSFSQAHPTTYQVFLGRRIDKSSSIRAKWATSVGRIMATAAGGIGMENHSEKELLSKLSQMIIDSDERVRIAALKAVGLLDVEQIVSKLGPEGGMNTPDSILNNIAERVRDRKPTVRHEAITFLARAWVTALGAMLDGDESVKELLGPAPSKIFNAFYLNDKETNSYLDAALFEWLYPIGYPTLKKEKPLANGDANKNVRPNLSVMPNGDVFDADTVRTQRLLFLLDGLDVRAKQVFFALICRPSKTNPYMNALLKDCESYNGGVINDNEKQIAAHLNKMIEYFAKSMPDHAKASEDLKKFAKMHDRRSYALIRFCMAADSDYRKIQKSLKELERKIAGHSPQNASTFGTLKPLVLRVSNLFSNKSHIRPMIKIAQTNEYGLGSAAHDLLKHISNETPAIFKSHSTELCRSLEASAPSDTEPGDDSSLDSLKACASFAKKFPDEVPKERKFLKAMTQFALRGQPALAAKHAVTIIMHASDSKQMYAKDLVKACTHDFQYGSTGFMSKLACLSQLMLLGAEDLEDEADNVIDIAINQVLKNVRNPDDDENATDWTDSLDEECEAKIWSLRILVNRIRHFSESEQVKDVAPQVYKMLNLLIKSRGELSKSADTPKSHASRLRLEAALFILKLSSKRGFDTLLDHESFNMLALTAQDPIPQIRSLFINKIRKLLGQDRLPSRFYIPVFLLAYEPGKSIRTDSITWLRARATAQHHLEERAKQTSTMPPRPVLETQLARFLALLAHHPDFDPQPEELKDFVKYITFYLSAIATEQNLSLITHVAQRVKSAQDGLVDTWDDDVSASDNLYVMADLALSVIREWQEQKGWSLQVYAGKVALPAGVFKPLPSHDVAREVATRSYLPDGFEEIVEEMAKEALGKGAKKRKSEANDEEGKARKRAAAVSKGTKVALPRREKPAKTPADEGGDSSEEEWGSARKKRRKDVSAAADDPPSSERRKSSRRAGRKSYAENSGEDEEMDDGAAADEVDVNGVDGEADGEIVEEGEEAHEDIEDEQELDGANKANASPSKPSSEFDVPRDEDDDKASGSSKENAGTKTTKPAFKRKTAPAKKAPPKPAKEPRVGTRTSARRAKAS